MNVFQEPDRWLSSGFQQESYRGGRYPPSFAAVTVAAHPVRVQNVPAQPPAICSHFLPSCSFSSRVIVRYALPQAVLNHGEAPFGFIHRAWALLSGCPSVCLSAINWRSDASPGGVRSRRDIGIIGLFQTVIDFTHLVNKRTAGNFCWWAVIPTPKHSDSKWLFDGCVAEVRLVFSVCAECGQSPGCWRLRLLAKCCGIARQYWPCLGNRFKRARNWQ